MSDENKKWIEELEIPDANVKWGFSHFAGQADTYNDPGDHNFQVILDPEMAARALDDGWPVREMAPREEGDPPEFLLKCKISDKFGMPKVFFIKGERKVRAKMDDLGDITRAATLKLDVILKPNRWVSPQGTGITAYVEEMYVTIKESRFSAQYADYEEI